MRKTAKILTWIILIAGAATLLEFFVFGKNSSQPVPPEKNNISSQPPTPAENLPSPPSPPTLADNAPATTAPDPAPVNPLPAKFLLPIPFYSQAPLSKWDAVHEEMCEESSVLNAGLYLLGEKLSKDAFEKDLMNFKKLEERELGEYKSNTIAEIKKATDIYFAGKVSSKIIVSPTVEDIEAEIVAGHPVVVPLAGREIGNPNFTPPGPIYHMLVIKGYDAQNFITNDVGTRKGDSYTYTKDVIMKNIHDWNPQDIHLGAKKVLVLLK